MPLKLVFLALFLANVELLFAVRYPQYEDQPSRRQSHHTDMVPTQTTPATYKSNSQLDLISKKTGDNQFSEWLQRRFDSLGSNGGLRRFQKGTNSLRRNNVNENDKCRPFGKKYKEKHLRRSDSGDSNELDLKHLDKKIQQLIRVRTLRRFQKALESVISDDNIDSGIDSADDELAESNLNESNSDNDSEESDNERSLESSGESNNEGSVGGDNDNKAQ